MMFNDLYDEYTNKFKATSDYTDKDIGSLIFFLSLILTNFLLISYKKPKSQIKF